MNRKNTTKRVLKHFEFIATRVTKDASGECIIEGYANTSTKDRVGDVVLPEAFRKSLPTFLKNPILLANHDWNDPCGKVLTAEITDKGLYIKARISDSRPDIKTLINEGCLSTFSIGYNEIDADTDDSTKTKYVKELELLEISVVTVPANTEASFVVSATKDEPAADAKAAPVRTAKELKEFIDTIKSVVGNELTGNEILGICDYFNNPEEEIMTKAQLLQLLKEKSAAITAAKDATPAAAPAAAATPVVKTDAAVPAEAAKADAPADATAAKPEGADEVMKQILAKLDAIGQGLAQIMEAQKPASDKPADDGKSEKPAADGKPADEEEMSDEDAEKALAEITADIAALEDSENA
jgi:HK97 family phage prohead protease